MARPATLIWEQPTDPGGCYMVQDQEIHSSRSGFPISIPYSYPSGFPISMRNNQGCRVCLIPTSLVCGRCRGIRYCSKKCQTSDWKTQHRRQCFGSIWRHPTWNQATVDPCHYTRLTCLVSVTHDWKNGGSAWIALMTVVAEYAQSLLYYRFELHPESREILYENEARQEDKALQWMGESSYGWRLANGQIWLYPLPHVARWHMYQQAKWDKQVTRIDSCAFQTQLLPYKWRTQPPDPSRVVGRNAENVPQSILTLDGGWEVLKNLGLVTQTNENTKTQSNVELTTRLGNTGVDVGFARGTRFQLWFVLDRPTDTVDQCAEFLHQTCRTRRSPILRRLADDYVEDIRQTHPYTIVHYHSWILDSNDDEDCVCSWSFTADGRMHLQTELDRIRRLICVESS